MRTSSWRSLHFQSASDERATESVSRPVEAQTILSEFAGTGAFAEKAFLGVCVGRGRCLKPFDAIVSFDLLAARRVGH